LSRRVVALLLFCSGCAGEQWECVTESTDCAALYEPTYTNVYENTIRRSCGAGELSCHGEVSSSDLDFSTIDSTYNLLIGSSETNAYVVPGEPNCSLLTVRIDQANAEDAMPPGMPLGEAERCAVRQWVEQGALR
jgi:hypothetical protein